MSKKSRRLFLIIISCIILIIAFLIAYYIYDYNEIIEYISFSRLSSTDPRYIKTIEFLNSYKDGNIFKQIVYYYPNISPFIVIGLIFVGSNGLLLYYNTKRSTIIFNECIYKHHKENR